jgi:hypothetical protein
MRRTCPANSDKRGINSGDVSIREGSDSRISIRYECRDDKHDGRDKAMKEDLDSALADSESLLDLSSFLCERDALKLQTG